MNNICTQTGAMLYKYFVDCGGILSTDPNFDYYLPDGTTFKSPEDLEDWFIRTAKQIENERIRIIINKTND